MASSPKKPRRTAERILEVTLELFNRFGEPNVSTTLISAELNISPGNLYYHYPAKDELINSLFDRYEKALRELLQASDQVRNVEDAWLLFHMLFELIWQYRFLYRDLNDLLSKNRRLETHFQFVLKNKGQAMRALIAKLHPDHGIIGEEFSDVAGAGRYNWILDPIDGTRAFITGAPVWGTLIGLQHEGQPILGLMSQTGFASYRGIEASLDASPATIRRDLARLEEQGLIVRVHGGANAVRAVACLPALTGAWRHRAGGVLLSSSGSFPVDRTALQRPDLLAGRSPRTINMVTIGDDLLRESSSAFGPKIEALVIYNSNPVAVAPDSSKVVRGFAREDLFTVVLEHFQTDTADYADYVLPATTQLEHWDVHLSYGHTDVLLNRPAIAPQGQARSNAQIFRDRPDPPRRVIIMLQMLKNATGKAKGHARILSPGRRRRGRPRQARASCPVTLPIPWSE